MVEGNEKKVKIFQEKQTENNLDIPRCDSDTPPETDYETEQMSDTSSLKPIIRPVSQTITKI